MRALLPVLFATIVACGSSSETGDPSSSSSASTGAGGQGGVMSSTSSGTGGEGTTSSTGVGGRGAGGGPPNDYFYGQRARTTDGWNVTYPAAVAVGETFELQIDGLGGDEVTRLMLHSIGNASSLLTLDDATPAPFTLTVEANGTPLAINDSTDQATYNRRGINGLSWTGSDLPLTLAMTIDQANIYQLSLVYQRPDNSIGTLRGLLDVSSSGPTEIYFAGSRELSSGTWDVSYPAIASAGQPFTVQFGGLNNTTILSIDVHSHDGDADVLMTEDTIASPFELTATANGTPLTVDASDQSAFSSRTLDGLGWDDADLPIALAMTIDEPNLYVVTLTYERNNDQVIESIHGLVRVD